MHELSIAQNLVDIAEQAARDAGASAVQAVHLRLGVFSGVVKDALLFAYDIATENTLLQDSELIIEEVALTIHCATCQTDIELPSLQSFTCPHCGMPSMDIRAGREIEIVSLEVLDETEIA